MKIDNMRELYEELLRATSNGYRNRSIANPAVDFTKKAKAGDFDEMSDEEYYQALDKVNELNDVWQHRPSDQIGELLFTALENLTLSDSDVEDMAATLLCAYERSSKEHIKRQVTSSSHRWKLMSVQVKSISPVMQKQRIEMKEQPDMLLPRR